MEQKNPNSQLDVDQFSTGVKNLFDKIENPSILNLTTGTPAQELRKRIMLLSEYDKNIDKPILKAMANDMISVLISWLDDPQVLCCLIQGIWAAYIVQHPDLHIKPQLSIADTGFAKFLDSLIAYLDFMIIFLKEDMQKIVFFIPDLLKEISIAILGVILLLLQETCFALRNSLIKVILEWLNIDKERTWSKCLPLQQMLNIFKKYFHDHGLLSEIFEKIKGHIGGLNKQLKVGVQLPALAKDLEFLYWLRDLFIKLKRATINFDLCVDYEFKPAVSPDTQANKTPQVYKPRTATVDDVVTPEDTKTDPKEYQGYIIGSDGTILIDKDKTVSDNGSWIPKLSNSFLRDFIHNEYNIPYDVIDNTITRGTSEDHIQGTVVTSSTSNITDRCANTPTAEETLRWILDIRSRI